jgi:hypothetical protein
MSMYARYMSGERRVCTGRILPRAARGRASGHGALRCNSVSTGCDAGDVRHVQAALDDGVAKHWVCARNAGPDDECLHGSRARQAEAYERARDQPRERHDWEEHCVGTMNEMIKPEVRDDVLTDRLCLDIFWLQEVARGERAFIEPQLREPVIRSDDTHSLRRGLGLL